MKIWLRPTEQVAAPSCPAKKQRFQRQTLRIVKCNLGSGDLAPSVLKSFALIRLVLVTLYYRHAMQSALYVPQAEGLKKIAHFGHVPVNPLLYTLSPAGSDSCVILNLLSAISEAAAVKGKETFTQTLGGDRCALRPQPLAAIARASTRSYPRHHGHSATTASPLLHGRPPHLCGTCHLVETEATTNQHHRPCPGRDFYHDDVHP